MADSPNPEATTVISESDPVGISFSKDPGNYHSFSFKNIFIFFFHFYFIFIFIFYFYFYFYFLLWFHLSSESHFFFLGTTDAFLDATLEAILDKVQDKGLSLHFSFSAPFSFSFSISFLFYLCKITKLLSYQLTLTRLLITRKEHWSLWLRGHIFSAPGRTSTPCLTTGAAPMETP